MFISDLGDALVVDDRNWRDHVQPPQGPLEDGPGFLLRDFEAEPLGSFEGSNTFPRELLIPREEWRERIEEMERTKTRLSDMLSFAPNEWLNQSPTNYCWCYAVVHGVMIIRFTAGLPWERLSPFSVAAPIKQYRNVGGWGSQALAYIVQHGVANEKFWPGETPEMNSSQRQSANMNAIRNGRQYFESSRADAATKKITGFYDLRSRNFEEKMSCLLRRIPVPSGYNWMGHEMCSIDPIIMPNGGFGCLDMDHYGTGGRYNKRAMSESRGTADDQVAPYLSPPQLAA